MDPSSAFWQAGCSAIAKGKPSAPFTHSISPIDRKSSGSKESVRKEVDSRMEHEGKREEEEDSTKGNHKAE